MASRAEAVPGFAATLRLAATDAYAESLRLLAANIVWGLTLVAWSAAVLTVPPLVLLAPVLALPTTAIFFLTTTIARGGRVDLGAAFGAVRHRAVAIPAIGLAAAIMVGSLVLGLDFYVGIGAGTPLGWAFATVAAWGLVALWLIGWTAWPLFTDPDRRDRPVRDRLVLAALVVLAHPLRTLAMGTLLAVLLAVSTVAILPLLTVSVAIAALVSTRSTLPLADRLERRRLGRAEVPTAS